MITLPDKLRIGPMTYQVKLVKSAELDHLREGDEIAPSGESRPDECSMVINGDHHPQQQIVALFHEMFHLILMQVGKFYEGGDDELISVLAYGMAQVLRDNPRLVQVVVEWPAGIDINKEQGSD